MFEIISRVMEPGDWLKIRCDLCAHQVAWSRATAIERLGEGTTPAEARSRLKCHACGSRAKITVWI